MNDVINGNVSNSPEEVKHVFWLFRIGSKEERRVPDIVYSVILSAVLLLALLTHLPSLILIIRDIRRPNNVNLIYRNLFLVDIILMLVYIPMDIIWTQTRQDELLCQFKQ